MSLDAFYIYQLAWYVFGTIAAFVAAWIFWDKGSTTVDGDKLHMVRGLRLTGAGGIFIAVLLVIHTINPLKPLSDYNSLLILHSDATISRPEGSEDFKIEVTEYPDLDLGSDVGVALVPYVQTYNLVRTLDESGFQTPKPIPPGRYQLRITDTETGEVRQSLVRIPRSLKTEGGLK